MTCFNITKAFMQSSLREGFLKLVISSKWFRHIYYFRYHFI